MGLSSSAVGVFFRATVSSEPSWIQSLRYYISGSEFPQGLYPSQLTGQAEVLSVTVIKPQHLVLR